MVVVFIVINWILSVNMKCKNQWPKVLMALNKACLSGDILAVLERVITSLIGGIGMSNLPNCPKCHSEYTYEDGALYICPECAHEWTTEGEASEEQKIVKDANGNVLNDGDTVSVIKDLKVKGSSSVIKIGTKVKNIRLVEGDHDIDCKIDGFGAMQLKSEFVKKI